MKLGAMNHPRRELFGEIRLIAEMGFDYIDLRLEAPAAALETVDWRTVNTAIEDVGLDVICRAAVYLPVDNPSPRVRQAALDELRRSVDAAQLVGATLCTTSFMGWPVYMAEAAGYEYTRQLYSVLCQHGQDRGVAIALQNSPRNRHQLKYFREIFHRLPELKLLYDIGNGNVGTVKSTTRDYLFALADRLAHIHISDNDGQDATHLPLGTPFHGGINLLRELRELRSFRYDGTLTLAVFGERRWLQASAERVRELWPQAL